MTDFKPTGLVTVRDDQVLCSEALRAIMAVMKVDHTSLRNALLEEIVGLLRRANSPQFVAVSVPEKSDTYS